MLANIKTRPLKIVLVSTETRTNIISRGPRVSNAQEVHFNPKTVFIEPDQTKLEREQDIKLRKELAKKRESDPNWLIKNGEIVCIHSEQILSLSLNYLTTFQKY
jgi:hypothetical protein